MKNKKNLLIAGAVVCALILGIGIGKLAGKGNAEAGESASADSISVVSEMPEETEVSEEDQKEAEEETEESEKKDKEKDEKTDDSEESSTYSRTPGSGNGGGSASGGGSSGGSSGNGNSSTPTTQETKKEISFPYEVPGTSLLVEGVSSYDGVFLEDGSDSDISGCAALIAVNKGSSDIEYAEVTLTMGDQKYSYVLTDIPAGAMIVAQEVNKASCPSGTYESCTASVGENKLDQSSGVISVEENSDGALVVKNLTGSTIPCVRVFYKFYLPDEGAYVGGITYNSKITDLAANGSKTIKPTHYTKGSSRVVMVRTYDTKD